MKNEHTNPQTKIQYSIWNTKTNDQSALKEKAFMSMEKPEIQSKSKKTPEEPFS